MHIPPPVIMLIFIGILYAFNLFVPGLVVTVKGQQGFGIGITMIAFLLVIIAAYQFRVAYTTILPNKLDQMSALVKGGVFRFSRNPMYLGMAIIISGAGIYLGSAIMPIAVYAFVMIINIIQIKPEEAALNKIFGEEYETYCAQTRRWI